MARIPKRMLVYHISFSEPDYAQRLPTVAAAITASLAPGTLPIFEGAVRNIVTNCVASAAGIFSYSGDEE